MPNIDDIFLKVLGEDDAQFRNKVSGFDEGEFSDSMGEYKNDPEINVDGIEDDEGRDVMDLQRVEFERQKNADLEYLRNAISKIQELHSFFGAIDDDNNLAKRTDSSVNNPLSLLSELTAGTFKDITKARKMMSSLKDELEGAMNRVASIELKAGQTQVR